MNEPQTAAGPATKHGQYVLTVSKSWNWAAFDVNDIVAIEAEATQAEHERAVDACARMVIVEKAKARADALDEARARVAKRRADLIMGPGQDGGDTIVAWAFDEALAAIDALREVKNDQ